MKHLFLLTFLYVSQLPLSASEFSYDSFGKLKTADYPNVIITYSYDKASNLKGMSYTLKVPDSDSDRDNLDDQWEKDNGLNPFDKSDANKDKDGDGQSNSAEFYAGTDPQDAQSVFQISQSTSIKNGTSVTLTIQWSSEPGKTYKIEYSDDLKTWHTEQDNIQSTSPSNSIQLETTSGSRRFYRAVIKQ